MIGFIGLGQLGSRLASQLLQSGLDVMVFDANSSTLQDLSKLGAQPASNTAEIGKACEVVITCLPSPAASEAVMAGDSGVLSVMASICCGCYSWDSGCTLC